MQFETETIGSRWV